VTGNLCKIKWKKSYVEYHVKYNRLGWILLGEDAVQRGNCGTGAEFECFVFYAELNDVVI